MVVTCCMRGRSVALRGASEVMASFDQRRRGGESVRILRLLGSMYSDGRAGW